MRAFIFEPFRIPSDSMMPTLLDGDFIVVNKYAYGLRWPVVNEKFLGTGTPQRGDVVVFRYPPNPSVNYIKRLVGLPGDRIEVHDDHLKINGETITLEDSGRFNDGCYDDFRLSDREDRRAHPPGPVLPLTPRMGADGQQPRVLVAIRRAVVPAIANGQPSGWADTSAGKPARKRGRQQRSRFPDRSRRDTTS